MDVREESLGTTQYVPHPDRLRESSSTGRRGPAADMERPSRWPPGRGEGSKGNPEAKPGVVPRACCAPGTPMFARDALSPVTEERQRAGARLPDEGSPRLGGDRPWGRPRAAPGSRGSPPAHATGAAPGPDPGYPTRGEGTAAAMTGGRAPVCPAARAGSAPLPRPLAPIFRPLRAGSPGPRAG